METSIGITMDSFCFAMEDWMMQHRAMEEATAYGVNFTEFAPRTRETEEVLMANYGIRGRGLHRWARRKRMTVIYARVSIETQREYLERQITQGINWARRMNLDVVVYTDIGGRRELERLLADCEAGKVQGVWVARWSCLSRDLENLVRIQEKLNKANVQLFVEEIRLKAEGTNHD